MSPRTETSHRAWSSLLAHAPGDLDDVLRIPSLEAFGPHTSHLLAAIQTLRDIAWYRHVAEPIDRARNVIRVMSWSDALQVLDDTAHYVVGGCLIGPWDEMHRCDDEYPERHDWWLAARQLITGAAHIESPQVEGLDIEHDLLLTDYVYDFLNLLMMEIVFSDATDCTYFREQLEWFHAGHFPCGWEGDWPIGRMRVF